MLIVYPAVAPIFFTLQILHYKNYTTKITLKIIKAPVFVSRCTCLYLVLHWRQEKAVENRDQISEIWVFGDRWLVVRLSSRVGIGCWGMRYDTRDVPSLLPATAACQPPASGADRSAAPPRRHPLQRARAMRA